VRSLLAAPGRLAPLAAGAVLACVLAVIAPAAAGHAGDARGNPCESRQAKHLLCPNLRIGRAHDLYVDREGPGRVLLHATSDVRSRGKGPMEVRGRRNGWHTMLAHQRIYRAGGGHVDLPPRLTLRFTNVGAYFGGSYWKVHQLARFELWSVGGRGRLLHRVRTGPKLNYCLRDLERTRPGRRSPQSRHYPGCNQNPFQDRVTLGTSVGWSDIYPADYHQQYINVAGLRGCFAFVMRIDPENFLYESNERDNTSHRLVHLPYRGGSAC
jgi:hypothetical protein